MGPVRAPRVRRPADRPSDDDVVRSVFERLADADHPPLVVTRHRLRAAGSDAGHDDQKVVAQPLPQGGSLHPGRHHSVATRLQGPSRSRDHQGLDIRLETELPQVFGPEAGQHRHRHHQGPQYIAAPGGRGGGLAPRAHHRPAACGMQRQHEGHQPHRGGHGLHTEFAARVLEEREAWTLVEAPDVVGGAAGAVGKAARATT